MKIILTAWEELYGLFVEDGSLALGILTWLGIAGWLFPPLGLSEVYRGPLLFGGLCVLLVENVYRSAKRHSNTPK